MPLTTLQDGGVRHTGPGSCGRTWYARDGQSALERAMHCPDLNDEMLSTVVTALAAQATSLTTLAAEYQAALGSSLTDRATLHENVSALTQQLAALSTAQANLAGQVAALAAQRTTIKYKAVQAPAIVALLGGSVDVTVVWDTPFPDANYTVYPPSAITQGVSLLGKANATLKSKAADKIVVTVTTSAAVTAGAVEVHALAYRVGV